MIARSLLLSIGATAVLGVGAALACSCVRPASAAAQLRNTEVMFVGVAQETITLSRSRGATRFAVSRTLKGEPLDTRWVEHSLAAPSTCGLHFERGRRRTVLARLHDGRLSTGACSDAMHFPLADYERALGLR
jgi:hypothetical protein